MILLNVICCMQQLLKDHFIIFDKICTDGIYRIFSIVIKEMLATITQMITANIVV